MLTAPEKTKQPAVLQIPAFQRTGCRHAFSTRGGGIPYGSSLAAVESDFVSSGGFPPSSVLMPLDQVHGADVARVSSHERPASVPIADGAVTDRAGVVLMVRTADCVPVLLDSPEAGVVGVAHAGWRGALAGVLAATLDRMVELGARPQGIQAAVGPAIGPCCFQVGGEVAELFGGLSPHLVAGDSHAPRVDLPGAVVHLLEQSGLPAGAIHVMRNCTACRPDILFSHRGEHGRTGRLIAAVGLV